MWAGAGWGPAQVHVGPEEPPGEGNGSATRFHGQLRASGPAVHAPFRAASTEKRETRLQENDGATRATVGVTFSDGKRGRGYKEVESLHGAGPAPDASHLVVQVIS